MFEAPSNSSSLKVYTFYSYKGGVGRSMALVNVGVLLALAGKRVLLVDWDLEAPGLEVYFKKAAKLGGDPRAVPGIVDLLEARAAGSELPWKKCLISAEFLGHGLDVISAGSKTEDYRRRVQQLDWATLYKEHKIGNYVVELREQWRDAYDFVLVDSRTGITDIGDICTVLLPDVIVLMFVTNQQNVDGIKDAMARAEKERKRLPVDRAKLHGIPLPSRDEVYSEYDKSLEWKRTFAHEFGDIFREWLPRTVTPEDALNKLFIPYVTNWSFGERIPVLESERETQDPRTIGASYKRLANLIASGLDWYSLEGKVTVEDLQGAQLNLLRERQASRRARRRLWVVLIAAPLIVAVVALWVVFRKPPVTARPQSTDLVDGRELYNKGKTEDALKVFQARAALLKGKLKSSPDDLLLLKDVEETDAWLGDALKLLGRSNEALVAYGASKSAVQQILSKSPSDQAASFDLAGIHTRIGDIFEIQGKLGEALAAFRSGKTIIDSLLAQDPSNSVWQRELDAIYNRLGYILEGQGKLDEALASFRSGETISERLAARDPSNLGWQKDRAVTYNSIGRILEEQGKLDEALASFRSGKTIMDKLTAQDPSNTGWQRDLAVTYDSIGDILEDQGKLLEALASFRSLNTIMDKLTAQDPANADWQRELSVSYNRVGRILEDQGKVDEALASFRSGKTIMDKLSAQDPSNAGWQRDLEISYRRTGEALYKEGKLPEALSEFARAKDLLEKLHPADSLDADVRRGFIALLRLKAAAELKAGDAKVARISVEQAYATYSATKIEKGAENYWQPEGARVLTQRGEILQAQGQPDLANKDFHQARALLNRLLKATPNHFEWKRDLAKLNGLQK